MGTRWYAPGQGRFTSRDAMFGENDSPISLNQFAHDGNGPPAQGNGIGLAPHDAAAAGRVLRNAERVGA